MNQPYDIAIIGGGLAGLSLSIQLAAAGRQVLLLEKERYPFHRVCGEYISMESWDFLCALGVPLAEWHLPRIKRLQVTAPDSRMLETRLPLGGFGVSRYRLDACMAGLARAKGVTVLEGAKVHQVDTLADGFVVHAAGGRYHAKVCAGAWGKRSNLDVHWQRPFVSAQGTRISNWVGIKYHIRYPWPTDLIGLHNFRDGYCGISQVEDGWCCLCYLTRAANLKGATIAELEASVMSRNPALRTILHNSQRRPGFPLAISQVSFMPKTQVEQGVLLLGDAAGMITPLCGNGMSMALHASKIACVQVEQFLNGQQSRSEMEAGYTREWRQQFGRRLQTGRTLQRFFGSEKGSSLLVGALRYLPALTRTLIRQTHGQPF